MVIEFDASTQSGLGVDGQFINQEKDDAFKVEWVDVCFCKHFKFITDEVNTFSIDAIDIEDIGLYALGVIIVECLHKLIYQIFFTGPNRSID